VDEIEPFKYPRRFTGLWFLERLRSLVPVSLAPDFVSKHRRNFVSRCFVLAKNISGARARPLPDGLTFFVLGDDDIRRLAKHEEARNKIDYFDRVRNGDICYGLSRDGELLTYNWIRFNRCCVFCSYAWELGFLPLSETQAFTYDFYTYKAQRKNGYGTLLKEHLLAELNSKGIDEVFSIVYRSNYASLSIHFRLDYEVRYLFNGYQLLDRSSHILIPPDDLPRLGEWITGFREMKQIPTQDCRL
jgi:hypothetical protein